MFRLVFLYSRSLEDKDKWMSAIGEAMDNAFPNQRFASTHEAVMHTFESSDTSCAYCHKLLKGLFYQGTVIFVYLFRIRMTHTWGIPQKSIYFLFEHIASDGSAMPKIIRHGYYVTCHFW